MPIVNGKVVRARYTSLKLDELSSVDNPAQPGALAMIMKRMDDPPDAGSGLARAVAKYIGSDDGAHTFAEVLTENQFDREIWPLTDALSQSIRSIMGDTALSSAERDRKVTVSVDEFLTAVRALDPPLNGSETVSEKVEKQLRELIMRKDDSMPKTVADLEVEIAALKGQITTLTARAEKAEGERDTAVTDKTAAETERDTAKAALATATDETLKIGDVEIKKSVVGADNFAVHKAQEERVQRAELAKRADAEFAHVPGTAAEKADVLALIATGSEDTVKAAEAILAAAEKLAAGGFDRLGSSGALSPTAKAAVVAFTEKVVEIRQRDECDEATAMSKARREHPDLFADYQEAGDLADAA